MKKKIDKKVLWVSTVQTKYKIHIPIMLRDLFNINVGDQVVWFKEGDCVYIKKLDNKLHKKMVSLLSKGRRKPKNESR